MLILANYPLEGVMDDGTIAPTARSRINLQRLIRTHETNFMTNEVKECDGEIVLNDIKCEAAKISDTEPIKWYTELLREIEKDIETINFSPNNLSSNVSINNYKCTNLNEYLKDLLLTLPLWGSVMCEYFEWTNKTGNSCNVERQFSLIKSNIFKKYTLPVGIAVFVREMVKRVNSAATLTKLILKRPVPDEKDIEEDSDAICEPNVELETQEAPKVNEMSYFNLIILK